SITRTSPGSSAAPRARSAARPPPRRRELGSSSQNAWCPLTPFAGVVPAAARWIPALPPPAQEAGVGRQTAKGRRPLFFAGRGGSPVVLLSSVPQSRGMARRKAHVPDFAGTSRGLLLRATRKRRV